MCLQANLKRAFFVTRLCPVEWQTWDGKYPSGSYRRKSTNPAAGRVCRFAGCQRL